MSSLLGLLHVGAASLGTNQAGAAVHGNNVANAQTPGYSRRDLRIDEGRGALGGGVIASGISRSEDFILSQQIARQHGDLLNRNLLSVGLQKVEQALKSGQSNLSLKVTELASALSELSTTPADLTRRGDVLAKGRAVAMEFNRVAQSLGRLAAEAESRARNLLPGINDLARRLADLNQRTLTGATSSPDGAPLGRLLDQRDQAAMELAGLVGGDVLRNGDGSLDVLVSGLSLVHGTYAQELDLVSQGGALRISIGGAMPQAPAGGEIGAALFAGEAAQRTLAQFDRLALDFSATLNAQHAFGVGLDGMGARPFFERLGGVAGAALSLRLDPALTERTLAVGFTGQPGDNRNAVALANLIDQPVLEGGRASFRNVYARVAAQLGQEVQQVRGEAAASEEQAAALDTAREAIAGVSTDEEMTRLLAYQRGFEASARFIKAVDEMLQQLTNL